MTQVTSEKIRVRHTPRYINFFDELDVNNSVLSALFNNIENMQIANCIINNIGSSDRHWRNLVLSFTDIDEPTNEVEWSKTIKSERFLQMQNKYYRVYRKLKHLGIISRKQIGEDLCYYGSLQFCNRLDEISSIIRAKIEARNSSIKNQ